jgi:hypothetical protein
MILTNALTYCDTELMVALKRFMEQAIALKPKYVCLSIPRYIFLVFYNIDRHKESEKVRKHEIHKKTRRDRKRKMQTETERKCRREGKRKIDGEKGRETEKER